MDLDSDVQAFLESQRHAREQHPVPPLDEQTPAFRRAGYRMLGSMFPPETPVESSDGIMSGLAHELGYRVYDPGRRGPRGALLFFHGGGYVIGDLDSHDPVCHRLAHQSGCKVVSVDYRLAPEHPFPAAVEDGSAAYGWVVEHARELGIDAERIAIGGDSAGGGLAAVVSLIARDTNGPMPRFQLLLYPSTDFRFTCASLDENAMGYLVTKNDVLWFADRYVSEIDRMDWRASPLLAPSHTSLPPTLVITAGFDPIRDDGRAYAEKLTNAGVPTRLSEYEGTVHGFVQFAPALRSGRDALSEAADALRSALAPN